MEIENKINNIKGKKYEGSSLQAGKLYHDLPFEGLENFRKHRSRTRQRIDQIVKLVNVKDRSISDIGCSVGGISIGMAMNGARKVSGFDHDKESIEVAISASKHLGLNNARFYPVNIDLDFIKNMKEVDIVVWLSQWMWFVKQNGIEVGKEALFEISKKAKTLVFESAADDGMAAIKGSIQDDIEKWLYENTIYEKIEKNKGVGGWHDRNIFVCSNPVLVIKNKWVASNSIIERVSRYKIKKNFKQKSIWMKERETKALKRLEKYNHFPKVFEEGDDYIIMEYVGRQNMLKQEMISQVNEIMSALEIERIKHRDIREENLVVLNGVLYLIDFGMCIFDDEEKIPDIVTSRRFDFANNMDKENIIKCLSNH